jgi:hypothetical protein
MNVEIRTEAAQFLFCDICFEFSVLSLLCLFSVAECGCDLAEFVDEI